MRVVGKAERKYLESHAEPEAKLASLLRPAPVGHAVVIPAYGEGEGLTRVLDSLPGSPLGDLLTILVVNARADSPLEVHSANARSCALLRDRYGPGSEVAPGVWQLDHDRGPLILIERASEGRFLPARQGVGLARKIGADLALAVAARQGLHSGWIHCTDADARLPVDYFERSQAAEGAALVHAFRHVHFSADGEAPASAVALEYEISLRYYVLGLRYAASPYAFHTIGSTIAVRCSAYAQVRGFPRRMAAEDFHLLAKLRKLGRVVSLAGEPIALSDRESDRVPFGTGAAVRRGKARSQRGVGLQSYHPLTFESLRIWLAVLSAASEDPSTDLVSALERRAAQEVGVDGPAMRSALEASGQLERARRCVRESSDPVQRRRRLHDGFDALAMLKLIHALRDFCAPSLPLREAVSLAPFLEATGDEPLEIIRDVLERAELQRELPCR